MGKGAKALRERAGRVIVRPFLYAEAQGADGMRGVYTFCLGRRAGTPVSMP